MAAPNCAAAFGLLIFFFFPCYIYCEVDQTYLGCYFDTEGNIAVDKKNDTRVIGQAECNRLIH